MTNKTGKKYLKDTSLFIDIKQNIMSAYWHETRITSYKF